MSRTNGAEMPQTNESLGQVSNMGGDRSPVGSMPNRRLEIEREKKIKVGSPEWFRLWATKFDD